MKGQLLDIVTLRNHKYTLKRFTSSKNIHVNNNWRRSNLLKTPSIPDTFKSVPNMPVFDTWQEARDYRENVTNGTLFMEDWRV